MASFVCGGGARARPAARTTSRRTHAAEDREPEQREHEHRHGDGEPRAASSRGPRSRRSCCPRSPGLRQRHHDGERAERRQRVREAGRTATPTRPANVADDDRDQQVARVRDARVGEHALDVPLRERDDVADDHRDDREPPRAACATQSYRYGNASSQTRRNAANAAAFTAAAMNAVIGVGAPS